MMKSGTWFTSRGLLYLAALIPALYILIPIYLIMVMAFSPRDVVYDYPKPIIPRQISTETLSFFLSSFGVLDSVRNSIVVAILTLAVSLVVGAPAGYALARYVFRGQDSFRLMILATRAFPIVILAVPLVVTYIRWGLDDTVFGVALLHTAMALPTTILVTSSIFVGVSSELEEAAMTMGCSRFGAFRRVALPLALPGLAASAIFTFVLSWNEVFAAAILTVRNPTLPAKLVVQLNQSPIPFKFAGGFFILIPALLFMLFVRRYLFSLWGVKLK
ncbi:MAG: carbohydrate ABC transporter permease [Chloroflexi bacterium]|nr:carbohydrate ABC transporter permease [Chloroflexota bacterium]MCI0649195.1 carbohydrate ABC transporter permease [Chloroflexota bacterium]MCI0727993.1 carbohydrate ABC transporter permease [Chloroflexota bacterium]